MRKAATHPGISLLCVAGLLSVTIVVRLAGAPQIPEATPQQIDFFEAKIRPILVN